MFGDIFKNLRTILHAISFKLLVVHIPTPKRHTLNCLILVLRTWRSLLQIMVYFERQLNRDDIRTVLNHQFCKFVAA